MRLLLAFLLFGCAVSAQTRTRGPDLETRPPSIIHRTTPEYTVKALQAGLEGTVVLYVQIGTDGRAHHIKVIRHLGLGLDEKAIAAVSRWRFLPGRKNGVSVVAPATIEVTFRLERPDAPVSNGTQI
jgi:TonB family protein